MSEPKPKPLLPEVEPSYDHRFVTNTEPFIEYKEDRKLTKVSRPMPRVDLLYKKAIVNCPGKTIVTTQVNFSPHASTPPHTHAGAFVSAYVMSGYIFNKMNDNPMRILGPGESFEESPTCRHKICENASETEPASVLATLILDTKRLDEVGVDGLVVIDEEYREVVEAQKRKKHGL